MPCLVARSYIVDEINLNLHRHTKNKTLITNSPIMMPYTTTPPQLILQISLPSIGPCG